MRYYLLSKAGDIGCEKPWDLLYQQDHVVPRQKLRQALQTPLDQPPNIQVKNRRLGPFGSVQFTGTTVLRSGFQTAQQLLVIVSKVTRRVSGFKSEGLGVLQDQ